MYVIIELFEYEIIIDFFGIKRLVRYTRRPRFSTHERVTETKKILWKERDWGVGRDNVLFIRRNSPAAISG